jgi:excisionase family DNA binding protein
VIAGSGTPSRRVDAGGYAAFTPMDLNTPANSPDYLSPQEFARLSGLGIATVRRYLKAGRLPFTQPAGHRGRVLIPRAALKPPAASPPAAPAGHGPAPPSHPVVSDLPGPTPRWRRGRAR